MKQKKFPPTSEIGDTFKENSFFKKQVSLKKHITSLQKNLLFGRIKKYNEFYGTSFFAFYRKVGEADLYKLEKITGGIEPTFSVKVKKVRKKIEAFLEIDGQYSLFPI